LNDNKLKTIAILGGTGELGPGLALRWAQAGYRVLIGSRQAEKAQGVADELKAKLDGGQIRGMENAAAAQEADICVLTVEASAHEAALESVKDALGGKILVDATARINFPELKPPSPPSAGRIAQTLLGESGRVVAAFQNIPARALQDLSQTELGDVLVCADELEAAEAVMPLIEAAGMRAYYAGDLDKAIVVEGLTTLMVALNKHYRSRHGTIKVAGIPRPND
jgi:hypothetical protein